MYICMEDQIREKVRARVKRIAGQIAGVQRMIEEERYCVDVLNQISAVRSALDAWISRHTRWLRRGDRPAVGIQTACPIDLYEWLASQKLPRPAIQNIEEAIAIAPKHQLARAAVPIRIGQDRNLH